MKRAGIAYLPLHDGYVPRWLFGRMVKMSKLIIKVIIEDFGIDELLIRLSDPIWFQSLGCVLGFDWHSSGLTTVVTGALKEAAKETDLGIYIVGGKGKVSRNTPIEIFKLAKTYGFDASPLIKVSRLTAKVDNTLVLDGYSIYHHVIFFDDKLRWTVVQQGMNVNTKYARRYHWTYKKIRETYTVEPHTGLMGDKIHSITIDMTAKSSDEAKKISMDIIKENRLRRDLIKARDKVRGELDKWIMGNTVDENIKLLYLPRNLNWKAVREAYELQPRTFDELLLIRGFGPETMRALALISEIIYGAAPSKRDPIRYTFAVGGKDGVPFPINIRVYDTIIKYFEELLEKIRIKDRRERIAKLSNFLPNIVERKY